MNKDQNPRASLHRFFGARNTRRGALSIAITAAIVIAVVLLNIVISSLTTRHSLYLDTTANNAYRLQEVTADYAASVKKDVAFYVLAEEAAFEDYGDYYVQANKLIRQFCDSSEHISLHYLDLITHPTFHFDYPDVNWNKSHLCLVVCGENYRAVDAEDMFDYEQDSSGYYYATGQHIEQAIASAVLTVTSDDIPTVAVLTGQGEEDASAFTDKLRSNAYQVTTVDLSTDTIPEEAEFLFIYAPAVDIDDEMLAYLLDWLNNNGSFGHHLVYVPTDQRDVADFPNLNALLAEYGMSLRFGYIYESDRTYVAAQLDTALCSRFEYADAQFTEAFRTSDIPVYLYCTLPISIDDPGLAHAMLTSSEEAFFGPMTEDPGDDFTPDYHTYNGAAVGTRSNGSTDNELSSHVVVIGSSRAFYSYFLQHNAYNNAAYFINIFHTLSSVKNSSVIIEGKDLSADELGAGSSAAIDFLTVLVRWIIPACVLIAGLIIWLKRRHR